MEFLSIVSGSKEVFDDKVNTAITRDGFKPFGSISIANCGGGVTFAIAMVKEA